MRLGGPGVPGPLALAAVAFVESAEREPSVDPVGDALVLAGRLAAERPFVGEGGTADLWEALATLAAHDLAVARTVEPHVDALTILHQAGLDDLAPAGSTWGVFAAEGPGVRLEARADATGAWRLSGTKPWCSLAGRLSHALVTAWVSHDERRLFAVDLGDPGVRPSDAWSALGLPTVPSGPVDLDDVPARPVGEAGWYLRRPGFAWGGASVAACWHGGATGLARALLEAARRPRSADDALTLQHVGAVDVRLDQARRALAMAAAAIDAGELDGSVGALEAARVRGTVARTAEDVLRHVAHALGPAPLAQDARHAQRVADLELYVRQHHAERDDVSLGRKVRDLAEPW